MTTLKRFKNPRVRSWTLWFVAIFVMILVFLLYINPDFVVNLEALQSFCS